MFCLGVTVIKYGRSGKSHLRRLYCDESLSSLFWRDVHGTTDHDTAVEKMAQKRKSSLLGLLKGDDDRQLLLKEALSVSEYVLCIPFALSTCNCFLKTRLFNDFIMFKKVTDDISPEFSKKALARRTMDGIDGPTNVVSIHMSNRTIDFEVNEVPIYLRLLYIVKELNSPVL